MSAVRVAGFRHSSEVGTYTPVTRAALRTTHPPPRLVPPRFSKLRNFHLNACLNSGEPSNAPQHTHATRPWTPHISRSVTPRAEISVFDGVARMRSRPRAARRSTPPTPRLGPTRVCGQSPPELELCLCLSLCIYITPLADISLSLMAPYPSHHTCSPPQSAVSHTPSRQGGVNPHHTPATTPADPQNRLQGL